MTRPEDSTEEDSRNTSLPDEQAGREELFDMINGYWRTQMLCTAAELGLADQLADGPCDITMLAERTASDARELDRLMRALAGFGIFACLEDGRYASTALGRWLERDRHGSMHARALLTKKLWYPAWSELSHSVRTGQTALDHVFGSSLFEHLSENPGTAAIFDATMADSTTIAATEVANAYDTGWARTIVDLGGGAGALLTSLLERNPHAHGVLVDTPEVISRAHATVTASTSAQRCTMRAGDFFTDVPPGADLYVLSWILHDWPDDQAIQILTTCRRAMTDASRVLIAEAILPEHAQPTIGYLYDLHMMAVAGGRERTEREYDALLAAAGLERTATRATNGVRTVLEARPARTVDAGRRTGEAER